jgi:flagella basal body P-ring formation protein FlgA
MMKRAISFAMAAVLMLIAGRLTFGADTLTLRERVAMRGPVVRLADVAEIDAGEAGREQRLAALPLMPAPAAGTQRFLRRREIADLLAAHGIDLGGVQFEGPDQVEITTAPGNGQATHSAGVSGIAEGMNRHAAVLAGRLGASRGTDTPSGEAAAMQAQISRLIEAYLATKTDQAANWRVSLELADRHLALLASATAVPVVQGGNAPWTGRQRFLLALETRAGLVHVPIYADVEATSKPVVVAVQPLARGELITAAHLERKAVDHLPAVSERRVPVESLEAVIGMEARQAIRAGEVLYTDHLQAPVLVRRGEVISVSSSTGGIRVRTTARARQDGAQGELVQLESLATRERFEARVTGPREAAVFAPTRVDVAQRSPARN